RVVDHPRKHRLALGPPNDIEEFHAALRIWTADRDEPTLVAAVLGDRLVPDDLERRLAFDDRLAGTAVGHVDQIDLVLLHELLRLRIVAPPGLDVRFDLVELAEGAIEIDWIE